MGNMKPCSYCGEIPLIQFCEDECEIACDKPKCKIRVSVRGVNAEEMAIQIWNEIADTITKIGGEKHNV